MPNRGGIGGCRVAHRPGARRADRCGSAPRPGRPGRPLGGHPTVVARPDGAVTDRRRTGRPGPTRRAYQGRRPGPAHRGPRTAGPRCVAVVRTRAPIRAIRAAGRRPGPWPGSMDAPARPRAATAPMVVNKEVQRRFPGDCHCFWGFPGLHMFPSVPGSDQWPGSPGSAERSPQRLVTRSWDGRAAVAKRARLGDSRVCR